MGRVFLSRFMIVFLVAVGMLGCSSSSDSDPLVYDHDALILQACEKAYRESHAAWVAAETGGIPPRWTEGAVVDYDRCEIVAAQVFGEIDYWHEKPDQFYWQPSLETEDSGRGQCTDTAILIYTRLRDAGVPDDCLKMVIFLNVDGDAADDEDDGHMACCIVTEEGFNALGSSGFNGWNVSPDGMQAYFMCDLWGLWRL